jgi:hypothetical protein
VYNLDMDFNKFKLKITKDTVKKPIFFIPVTVLALVLVSFIGLIIWRPGIARGDYDIQSIVDMLLNHEKRITDLESKTDNTQTQTNQNSQDINKLQGSTNTTSSPTVPKVSTPVTTAPAPSSSSSGSSGSSSSSGTSSAPNDPNNNTWTDSHGTFVIKNMPATMYTGKDMYVLFSTSDSTCSGFQANKVNLIPANTKIVLDSSLPSWYKTGLGHDLDLSDYYDSTCNAPGQHYYFAFQISTDPANFYYPGNWGVWW